MRWFINFLMFGALLSGAARAAEDSLQAPELAAAVARGALPPLRARLPATPSVVRLDKPGQTAGRYGGSLSMLIGKARDVRLLVVYGYARLMGYNRRFELKPDILKSVDVVESRIFTMRLRTGHRWSDGKPFTTEDFRYYWEDVANNKELSPQGPPRMLLVDGVPPKVEILDKVTVRYTWPTPNPVFLHSLARARPLFLYRPAHYLRRFHASYGDPVEIASAVDQAGVRGWAPLHNRLDNLYKFDNVNLPTLQPWVNTTTPPATRFVAKRNPFFHRVDIKGRQLPYIDEVVLNLASSGLIAAKSGAGEVDIQARGLSFKDFTFLKQGEKINHYRTNLWRGASGAHFALFPNLNVNDAVWRELLRDVRFRRALSLGIDREIINQSLYFGLARTSNNTVLPESQLYREDYRTLWAEYDPAMANKLLDELGLERSRRGALRRLPDGRKAEIIVETAGEDPEQADVLELIEETWREIGIKLYIKPLQREVLRNRVYAGETLMAVWTGWQNGVAAPGMSPARLAPTVQDAFMWPKWGQYYETSGQNGEPVDLPEAALLLENAEAWLRAGDRQARATIWHRMLQIHAEQQFTIGVINGVPQPVIVRDSLRNVPEDAIFGWDPGAQLGIYQPDIFWFDVTGGEGDSAP